MKNVTMKNKDCAHHNDEVDEPESPPTHFEISGIRKTIREQ